MGGYGAIMNGMKYHETFSHIAALSSAILDSNAFSGPVVVPPTSDPGYQNWIFGSMNLDSASVNPRTLISDLIDSGIELPNLYIGIGTQDILFEQNNSFRSYLNDAGVSYTYNEVPDAMHNFDFWSKEIRNVLDWLPCLEKTEVVDSGNVVVK